MIERLYVNNFRCLENLTVNFTNRPSALVIGKNGAGKSTFRKALEVFQKICRGPNRVKQWIEGSDFTQYRKHIPMRFEADLKLGGKLFRYAIAFEMPDNFREARVAEENLAVDGDVVFTRQTTQVSLASGTTFGLDWHIAALPVIKGNQVESAVQQIKQYFASMILIAPIPAMMSGFAEEESVELQEDAGNFSEWMNTLLLRYPAAYASVFDYLKAVIPDLESFENVPRGESGKQLLVRFENKRGDNQQLSIEFKNLSDGEKCFFLSALIIAANKHAGPVFCIWDEPDNHLSLSEIGHFIIQLRKLTNQNGQFIAASHHPETIRRFSDETTLVFTRQSHLEPTVVRTLSELKYNGDLVEALLRDEVIE